MVGWWTPKAYFRGPGLSSESEKRFLATTCLIVHSFAKFCGKVPQVFKEPEKRGSPLLCRTPRGPAPDGVEARTLFFHLLKAPQLLVVVLFE